MSTTYPPTTPPAPPSPFAPPPPPRAPKRTGLSALVLTGALLVGGGAGLGGAAAWDAMSGDSGGSGSVGDGTAGALNVADTPDRDAPDGSVEEVAASVLPSVVALDVRAGGAGGSGSGVILSEDGLILTNDHVVSLGGEAQVEDAEVTISFNDGTHAEGAVVGTDPITDTALVQAEDVSGLTPITIGKSDNLDVGEQVVAIGSPYGLDATVTSGIVSALDRPVDVGQDSEGNVTAYPAIQTDAAINPGNSGGALVDMDGNLVGINASIQTAGSSLGGGTGSIGLGFAIPIDEIREIVDQLRAGEEPTHARLGIEVSDVGPDAPVLDGAQVRGITEGSAAEEAGLEEGDIITRIDDTAITGSDSLVVTVRSYRPGDTVEVTYLRGEDERTTELELGSD
ncbi:putative serine protease PepD [Nocardioides thalensis]|uniref:Putative serine protease PepD n=1 Tax=Nocardioides thalensis TaxID=1914755 RepID=A0A853C887_9ACTN|nr:trypsin-like peptidase domain-containing protein [Nocardioides thalensis]NYJ02678.1 putative serine protease PepD [Nocardioides thalensis]